MKIYMLSGIPGSGKSTHARKIQLENPGTVICCHDAIIELLEAGYNYDKSHASIYRKVEDAIISEAILFSVDLILDRTFTTKEKRKEYLERIQDYRSTRPTKRAMTWLAPIEIHCICFLKSPKTALINRMKEPKNISRETWERVIKQKHAEFEPPDADEGFKTVKYAPGKNCTPQNGMSSTDAEAVYAMETEETDYIKSEINETKEILAGLPEGHPIERMGFEARLKTLSETLKDKEAT